MIGLHVAAALFHHFSVQRRYAEAHDAGDVRRTQNCEAVGEGAAFVSHRQSALRDADDVSADAHAFEFATVHGDHEADTARPAHLQALFDHALMRTIGQPVERLNDAREADCGRTCRGVLRHAEVGREHAGVERGRGANALARIDVDPVDAAIRNVRAQWRATTRALAIASRFATGT